MTHTTQENKKLKIKSLRNLQIKNLRNLKIKNLRHLKIKNLRNLKIKSLRNLQIKNLRNLKIKNLRNLSSINHCRCAAFASAGCRSSAKIGKRTKQTKYSGWGCRCTSSSWRAWSSCIWSYHSWVSPPLLFTTLAASSKRLSRTARPSCPLSPWGTWARVSPSAQLRTQLGQLRTQTPHRQRLKFTARSVKFCSMTFMSQLTWPRTSATGRIRLHWWLTTTKTAILLPSKTRETNSGNSVWTRNNALLWRSGTSFQCIVAIQQCLLWW